MLKMFGSDRNEMTEAWGKLHIEKLHDLHSSPNVIRIIKSKESDGRGMWHVWGEERCVQDSGRGI